MSTSKQNGNDGSESTAVPLACVVCRERHLKCDGVKPTCSRCVDNKQNCYYVQSRRGHRPVRKRQRSAESNHSSELNEASVSPLGGDDRSFSAFLNPLGARMSYQDHAGEPHLQVLPQSADPAAQNIQLVRKPGTSQLSTNTTSEAELQELYYFFFHDAHPCMLPRDYTARTSAAIVPDSVKAAMNYVGSQYSTSARQNPSHLKRLQDSLFSKDSASDGWTVMALLILGIVQRAQDNNDLAAVTLAHAAAIANDLGMNRSEYASAMGGGCPILEEMWRRVWWELYVNDILLAAMRHDTFSRMYSAEADVGLPWEESQYKACTPATTRFIKDFDQLGFFHDDNDGFAFSSFAYRITAARLIGRLLKLNQSFCPNSSETVIAIDYSINNWLLHLPEGKKEPLNDHGVDEMLFQAHMMTNAASICLHRPRSDLIFTAIKDTNSCTGSRRIAVPAAKYTVHSAKCIQAADRIADLITLPGEAIKHTPLFTCMLTLSAVVHVSSYLLTTNTEQRALTRERIALSVGSLKSIKNTWSLADGVLQSIKMASREVMACTNRPDVPLIHSANDPYGTALNGNGQWIVSPQDPLFSAVPELLPPDAGCVGVSI